MTGAFRHSEDGRTVIFGTGAADGVAGLLDGGFVLLTTARAHDLLPDVAARATAVIEVRPGLVEDLAGALRGEVTGTHLVAVGGGRVVDVAKALAAADPPRRVTAVPTTLSGAEMTGGHRHAAGVPADTPKVRPSLVVNDPRLSASAPTPALAASSANALAHAVTAFSAADTDATARARAFEAVAWITRAWSGSDPDPDRPALARGALLAGWAGGASGIGLHHVLAQTLVRTAGLGHAQANALVLPVSISAVRARRPEVIAALEAALDTDLASAAAGLRDRAGAGGDPFAGDETTMRRAVDAAWARPELRGMSEPPTRAEIEAIYRTAAGHAPQDAPSSTGGRTHQTRL